MTQTSSLDRASACLEAGEAAGALALLVVEEQAAPREPRIQRLLARTYRALGRTNDALIADFACLAYQAGTAELYAQLGSLCLRFGQAKRAVDCYEISLTLDPENVSHRKAYAVALQAIGAPDQAQAQLDAAYQRQCVFVEPCATPIRRILIPAMVGLGNVPLEAIMPRDRNVWILWYVEYARDQGQSLPPFDMVFNAIGDADVAHRGRPALDAFLATCTKPVMNRPERIDPTRRDRMPQLLGDLDDVVMPMTIRIPVSDLRSPALEQHLGQAGLHFPLLARPLESHGGDGITFAQTLDDLRELKTDDREIYLTQYVDTRAADGFFRKYRMIFVDGKVLPYHLAISPKWLVHYFSADMMAAPWKREEESRFLADPARALGPRAMAGLAAIEMRLGLDFGGIDFTLLPDGRVLVFEANATMAVHLTDKIEDFPYKHETVPRIFEAVETMLARLSAHAGA